MAEEEEWPTFELLPADTEDFTPDEELAAIAALTDPAVILDRRSTDEVEPLGKTWVLDHETGRLTAYGDTPASTIGLGAVIEWCGISLRIARYVYPIFGDDIGMEQPDRLVGFIDEAERRAQYVADITETLLVHDRITEIKSFRFEVHPDDPEVLLMSAKVVVDGEVEADLEEIPLSLGEAA